MYLGMNINVFWDVMPCSSAAKYQHSSETTNILPICSHICLPNYRVTSQKTVTFTVTVIRIQILKIFGNTTFIMSFILDVMRLSIGQK
jgi:hypothetical protein